MREEVEAVKKEVCKEFGITNQMFLKNTKEGSAPTARYVYYYLLKKYGLFTTLKEIGKSIGRYESIASFGVTKITELIELDYNLSRRIKRIENKLNF